MMELIIFPDPVSSLTQITGAILLYFDRRLLMGLPASVVPNVGEQSFRMMQLLKDRDPPWAAALYSLFGLARQQSIGVGSVLDRLASVRDATLTSVYLSYAAGDEPFSAASEAATELARRLDGASAHITHATAASDLIRHIFLEAFLEKSSDTSALYEYCEQLFTNNSLEHLLLSAYLLRVTALKLVTTTSGVLLINPRVTEFLAAAVPVVPEIAPSDVIDVVAWEIFRRIISPRLDPLTDDRIALIGEIRNTRSAERTALVDRCRDTASRLVEQRGMMKPDELCRYVETRVEPEIAALLELDRKAVRFVIDELFSDKALWVALANLIAGLASGTPLMSATGAVTALAVVGADVYKAGVKIRSTIEESDLRLLYFIERRA